MVLQYMYDLIADLLYDQHHTHLQREEVLTMLHQNNYIQMTQNDEKTQHAQPQLCPKCNDMYGHPSFDLMCSICYKKEKNIQEVIQTPKITRTRHLNDDPPLPELSQEASLQAKPPAEHQQEQLPKGKCSRCSKKTGMLGYCCKHCSFEFCKVHRLPEDHSCSVDFVELGRKRIKMENPVVVSKKIEDI